MLARVSFVVRERVKDAKRSLADFCGAPDTGLSNTVLTSTSTPFFSTGFSSCFSPSEFLEILNMEDDFNEKRAVLCVCLRVVAQKSCKTREAVYGSIRVLKL